MISRNEGFLCVKKTIPRISRAMTFPATKCVNRRSFYALNRCSPTRISTPKDYRPADEDYAIITRDQFEKLVAEQMAQ